MSNKRNEIVEDLYTNNQQMLKQHNGVLAMQF